MPANDYDLYVDFHSPDANIAARERAPMLDQERAWAHYRASVHTSGWLQWTVIPLAIGPVLPALVLFLGIWVYQGLFDPDFDIDRYGAHTLGWLAAGTVLFVAGWVAWNRHRARHDPRLRYWRDMPEHGEVELERHTLIRGVSLWSLDYDPDRCHIPQWLGERIQEMPDSGVSQWILTQTAEGQWLVLRHFIAGSFAGYGKTVQPPASKHLQVHRDLAIAFAPRTNISLGLRFSGMPIELACTDYWLSAPELERLDDAAHHWKFFAPDRYGVVNPIEVPWIEALVAKAQAKAA